MKYRLLLASILLVACGALAPADPPATTVPITISVTAKGTDVKTILGDLFAQAHKNYVIQPETYFALHLTLDKVDFDEALMIIEKLANLKIELQNGIYYVGRAIKPKPTVDANHTLAPVKPAGTLPKTVLTKKLTTRSSKVDLRELFADISKQTGVVIEVEKSVPAYKLDAFLINTSLKYGLDEITQAAGLAYRFTDSLSIEIYKPAAPVESNRVLVVPGS